MLEIMTAKEAAIETKSRFLESVIYMLLIMR
jgi:hypothetical protein